MPNKFFARLNKSNSDFLSYVQKKDDTVIYSNGVENNSIAKTDFEALWTDIVLLVENENIVPKAKSKPKYNYIIPIVTIALIIAVIVLTAPKKWFLLFYTLPILGLLFSTAALKDLIITKSELFNKFCNVTANTSCKTVVNSTEWKFFDTISFSDLGILFFSTQLVGLFLMGLLNLYSAYFSLQIVVLLFSVPVIIASLYYQKYIEKKWCPICLSIIGVVILEFIAVILIHSNFGFNIGLLSILLFFATISLLTAVWLPLKKILKKVNDLKTVELKANRFKRNYNTFKLLLTSEDRYNLPETKLVFGNKNANLKISIITSPYCGFCEEPHYLLKSLLDKYEQQLNISIFYNASLNNLILRDFAITITQLKLKKGNAHYYEAMDYWYQVKEHKKWLNKYQININTSEGEILLDKQNSWFEENSLNFTPCLFINGYRYPKEYDIADLPFYIEELLDDKSLYVKKYKIAMPKS
ncbi:Vitamin K epoxide reductase [Winogradskyella psychrotolerans RS-3]|uniref:Vitamin K epoxide reductase n=1 Tax=Winogradskyella psychrotolerans RS-3 TaxID=641526 RepID=S7XAJ5_9FLAO|nr:vitamin K epoxide reductase family protein [Winogradskyella psychrotolerans]EPR73028.1 Vitamin K epoxide reductase [Winogradskyella psychrotolerans RS-3]